MKDNNLTDKLFNLLKQFGVTWNTFNLVKHLVKNNVILNERLTLDDLDENMWVWNETQGEYQIIRYISTHDLEDYHWCDGWGNNIENDELWRYKREDQDIPWNTSSHEF